MPHTRSAKKNIRKSEKRRLHNRMVKKTIKTMIKKFMDVHANGTAEQLQEQFVVCVKKLDKAAVRNIIHRNMAARKKSQLALKLNEKKKAPPAQPAS